MQHETITTHATTSEPIVSPSSFQKWQMRHKTITTHATVSEPIVSHSPFQRHETITTHATTSMRPLQLMPQQSETIVSHPTKQSKTIRTCSTNQIKRDKFSARFKLVVASVSNNVSIDLWQCQMEIKSTNNLVGFCHDNTSEQVMCSEQEQDAKLPSEIHDPSNTQPLTNHLLQFQSFVNNVLINSWQC
jgi:hypothetical protein